MSKQCKGMFLVLLFVITLMLSSFMVSNAEDIQSTAQNIGVSYVSLDNEANLGIQPYGVDMPSKVWNIKHKGQYNFAGWSYTKKMFTNYKFTGKTSYKVYVKNTGNNPITIKAKRLTKTYASTKVSAGKTATFEFSDIKSTTEFYITFDSSDEFHFEGYVK